MGCANPEGATGCNIARQIALRAGLPVTTAGVTVNRFCSCGLQTIAMAAQRIIAGEGDIFVGRRRREHLLRAERDEHAHDDRPLADGAQARDLLEHAADRRAGRQALQDRPRAHGRVRRREPAEGLRGAGGRQVQGRDRADHRPSPASPTRQLGLRSKEVTVSADEGMRAGTTYEGIKDIRPALPGGVIAAGNASQFTDGARRLRRDERDACREARARSRSAASSASRSPAASPTRWASARCSRCPRCSSAWA